VGATGHDTKAIDVGAARDLASKLVEAYSACRDTGEVFAPDCLFDVNIPMWRFQIRGAGEFFSWLRGYSPTGYRLSPARVVPSVSGFVVEVEGDYELRGEPTYFRNLLLCEVGDGRVRDLTFFCTGDWDPATRARHSAEVTLIRP